MDTATFDQFRTLIYQRSGISLGRGKETLVAARIGKRMRVLGIQSHQEYLQYTIDHEAEGELVQLLDAVSTNFTSFFREAEHFERLAGLVREWLDAGQRRLRLWSAASSTGEEPYTLAMVLREAAAGRELDARILATDISTRVLETACQGVYDKERVKPVPPSLRERYLEPVAGGEGPRYRVRPALRNMVVYKRLNLSTPPFPMQGPMDAVFCRNVMIYFDNAVRRRLVAEIRRLLKPGGYLFVGHAESLNGIAEGFRSIGPSVYLKEGGA